MKLAEVIGNETNVLCNVMGRFSDVKRSFAPPWRTTVAFSSVLMSFFPVGNVFSFYKTSIRDGKPLKIRRRHRKLKMRPGQWRRSTAHLAAGQVWRSGSRRAKFTVTPVLRVSEFASMGVGFLFYSLASLAVVCAVDTCSKSDCPKMSNTERTFIAVKPDGVQRYVSSKVFVTGQRFEIQLLSCKKNFFSVDLSAILLAVSRNADTSLLPSSKSPPRRLISR